MSLLGKLPLELFQAILEELDFDSLTNLSLVNKGIRSVCLPLLFKCAAVTFCTADFDSLLELVSSPVGRHVKALKYYTPPILKDSSCTRPFPIEPCRYANGLSKFPKARSSTPPTRLTDISMIKAEVVGKTKTVSICGTTNSKIS